MDSTTFLDPHIHNAMESPVRWGGVGLAVDMWEERMKRSQWLTIWLACDFDVTKHRKAISLEICGSISLGMVTRRVVSEQIRTKTSPLAMAGCPLLCTGWSGMYNL